MRRRGDGVDVGRGRTRTSVDVEMAADTSLEFKLSSPLLGKEVGSPTPLVKFDPPSEVLAGPPAHFAPRIYCPSVDI